MPDHEYAVLIRPSSTHNRRFLTPLRRISLPNPCFKVSNVSMMMGCIPVYSIRRIMLLLRLSPIGKQPITRSVSK